MASYPGGYPTFSTKVDGTSTVVAADPNLIQDEVLAIENILGTNPHQSTLSSVGSYVSNPTSTTFGTVTARVANIEAGLVSSISSGSTNAGNISSLTTRVGTAETNITNNASNISSLGTRMTAVEGVNTAQDSNISSLGTRMTTAETTPTISGTVTLSGQSGQYPVNLQINNSTHATSRRTAIQLGSNWQIGQDSVGNGTKDFYIYGGTTGANRILVSTDGSMSIPNNSLNVGTSTTNSAYQIQVSAVNAGLGLVSSSATGNSWIDFVNGSTVRGNIYYNYTNDSMGFGTYSGGARADRLTINSSGLTVTGNVTVSGTINGTTIPSTKTLVVTTDKLSALAATTSAELRGVISDETGTGVLVFGTAPTLSSVVLSASSGTTPPIKLTTGTLVSAQTTSATNGSFEYDGQVGYFSPVSAVNGRALLSTPFYYVNSTTRTLLATTTAAQAIFGSDSGAGVGLTLGSFSTYEFEIEGSVLANTTVSTNVTLKLSHNSYTLLAYHGTYGINQSSPTIIQKQSNTNGADLDLVIGAINTTTARPVFSIKGIIRTNTSQASFIPYVVLSAASSGSGSLAVGQGSYIKITPLGDNNVTGIGNWQ